MWKAHGKRHQHGQPVMATKASPHTFNPQAILEGLEPLFMPHKASSTLGDVLYVVEHVGESVIFQLKTATAADQEAWGHAIDFVFLF